VLQRLPIPRRIVIILEGESLVNDATALVLYRFAVAAVAAGGVAIEEAAFSFVLVAIGGIAVGWAIGWAANWSFRRLQDPLLITAMSFIACFASFGAAETLHLSGVIAVVTTGLVLGQLQHRTLTPETRIAAVAVWRFIEFVLTSLVFILVGLQLRGILDRIVDFGAWQLAGMAVALSLALIISRFFWVFPMTWLPRLVPRIRREDPLPPVGHMVVVSWAGMRGVVSLAAALALPLDFPQRDLLIFLAFCAILATLVVQGTTLEWMIRHFRVEEKRRTGMHEVEARARRHVAKATLAEIEQRAEDIMEGAVARDLLSEYRDKAGVFHRIADGGSHAELEARMRIRLAALRRGRAALLDHHRDEALSDELLAALESEMDLEELRIRALLGAG
jgi:CPA1 family monovalent cation:H+ antiporter